MTDPDHLTVEAAHAAAVCGDNILAKAGEVFTMNMVWNKSCTEANPITFDSSAPASAFPPANARIVPPGTMLQPANVAFSALPTFRGFSTNVPAIRTSGVARGYALKRILFTENPFGENDIIRLGNNESDGSQEFTSQEPREFVIDQVVVLINALIGQKSFLQIHARDVRFTNSWVDGIKGVGQDAFGVGCVNSSGDIHIENNFIAAAAYAWMTCYGDNPQMRTHAAVAASPAPTTSTFTLENFRDDAGPAHTIATLAVGQDITVQISATQREWRTVQAINGNAVTVTPALSVAPTAGFDVRWAPIADGVMVRRNWAYKRLEWRNPILSTPTDVSLSVATGGTLAAGTYGYRVVGVRAGSFQNNNAYSSAAAEVTLTTTATGSVRISWTAVPNATSYRVYRMGTTIRYFSVTAPTTTYTDTGTGGTTVTSISSSSPTSRWVVKNGAETKGGKNVTWEYNIVENVWQAGQTGECLVVKSGQSAGGPSEWIVLRNMTVRGNVLRNCSGAMRFNSQDSNPLRIDLSGPIINLVVEENLAYLFGSAWANSGAAIYAVTFGAGYFDGITMVGNSFIGGMYGAMNFNRTYSDTVYIGTNRIDNNIFKRHTYGVFASDATPVNNQREGTGTFNTYGIDHARNNVFAGAPCSRYPATNLCPTVTDYEAAFVEHGGADVTDYEPVAGHPWLAGGFGGGRIGANVAALAANVAGVIEGLPANAPRIDTVTLTTATIGSLYSFTLPTSGGTPPRTCQTTPVTGSFPSGLSLGASTCRFTGTPNGSPGTSTFTVRVTDSLGASSVSGELQLPVAAAAAVSLTCGALPDVLVDGPYNIQLALAGGNGTYSVTQVGGNMPPGVHLDSATGRLTGPATQAGPFTWRLRVESAGQSDEDDCTQTVGRPTTGPITLGRPPRTNGQDLYTFRTCQGLDPQHESVFKRAGERDICTDDDGRLNLLATVSPAVVLEPYAKLSEIWPRVVKAAPQPVSAQTTLEDDDDLQIPLLADTTYTARCFIKTFVPAAADMKWQVVFDGTTSSASFHRRHHIAGAMTYAGQDTLSLADTNFMTTSDSPGLIDLFIDIAVTGTPGTLKFRFAQFTSDAAPTVVREGSWCEYIPVP